MTREALPCGYAITYLPSRAILHCPNGRAIGIDSVTAYGIMALSIDGRDSAIVSECQRIERSH